MMEMLARVSGADLGGGCRVHLPLPPPPQNDLRFSNTTDILEEQRNVTGELTHSFVVHSLLRKILVPPLDSDL